MICPMRKRHHLRDRTIRVLTAAFSLFVLTTPLVLQAATISDIPFSALQAVVWVQCDDRQGSGTIINGQSGYVLTNAHVLVDPDTRAVASFCVVGLMDDKRTVPKYFYRTQIIRWSLRTDKSEDFAILQITRRISSTGPDAPFPFLKTNEFPTTGEAVRVLGYSGDNDELTMEPGVIRSFDDGFIQTSAVIRVGDSGGAGLDANNDLIGIPTRIVTITLETGATERIDYELVDIRAVMNWLDMYGPNEHDKFFTHADYTRYHKNAVFINQSSLGCEYTARTVSNPSVFCLLAGGERLVFPGEPVYSSWFPGYSGVVLVSQSVIYDYHIIRNVTFKPGTLVKSQTAPPVYVVVDNFGTMRWIPSETVAKQLWGPNWASLVRDIPDEFWANYNIGQPLEILP